MKKLEKKRIIRAADYLPKPKEDSGDLESFALPAPEQMIMGLFGDFPDYGDPKMEELWQAVFDSEEDDMIAYCLKRGVDVTGDDGKPVSGWRDIAVMLKAIEKGLLELQINGSEDTV